MRPGLCLLVYKPSVSFSLCFDGMLFLLTVFEIVFEGSVIFLFEVVLFV